MSLAFRFAREADPDARLVYNDYDIEAPEKRARTVRLLARLLAEGVRIDEVGIQDTGSPIAFPSSTSPRPSANTRHSGSTSP